MSVGRVCSRAVEIAAPDESAQVVASRMNTRNVGSIVVVDRDQCPIGIITDRDLAMRVVAKGLDPTVTEVGAVMSELPDSITESTPIESAISTMRRDRHRRLPVVDDQDRLVGLLSLDDVLRLLSEEFEEIGELLRKEGQNPIAL